MGAEEEASGNDAEAVVSEDEGLPFSRAAILEHLERGRTLLSQVYAERRKVAEDDLTEALTRVANLLDELERDFRGASRPDAQKLEISLTGLRES